MKLLPAKVIGASVTFTAVHDDGEVQSETYTNTPDGYTAEPQTKTTIAEAFAEFSAIAGDRELAKQIPAEPSVVDARAEYYDPDADFKKLTAKQVENALKAAFPVEVAPEPATVTVDPITEPAVPVDGG